MNENQKKLLAVLTNIAVLSLEIIHYLETGKDELGIINDLLAKNGLS